MTGYLRANSRNVRRSESGESSGFKESANDNVLVASDGSGGSRGTLHSVRQVTFGVDLLFAATK